MVRGQLGNEGHIHANETGLVEELLVMSDQLGVLVLQRDALHIGLIDVGESLLELAHENLIGNLRDF